MEHCLRLTCSLCLGYPASRCWGDVIPVCPAWPSHHMKQLELDLYETRNLRSLGDLSTTWSNMMVSFALPSMDGQINFTPCPCKCRKYPMSEERLKAKGIFGALVRIAGEFTTSMGPLPKTQTPPSMGDVRNPWRHP